MNRKIFVLISVLLVAAFMLTACGTAAATEAAVEEPADG